MISVEEAKRIMMERVRTLSAERVALASATDRYINSDVRAEHDHPLFDCSAVDGYAFAFDTAVKEWTIVGAVPAGDVFPGELRSGECVRIFTGAMTPRGADTVVMQEFTHVKDERMTHADGKLRMGGNVRRKGEQVGQGEVLVPSGARLNIPAMGLMASVGVQRVEMVRVPEVAVIVTGDEFLGETMAPGKIFGSNDLVLSALMSTAGALAEVTYAPDEAAALRSVLDHALMNKDLVVTTGGASVGDHDLIRPVLEAMGATIHFHGVAQKPGKPMLFATMGEKPIIALPGNPRAVMVLFWEYVLPFLRAMQGAKDPWLRSDQLPLAHPLQVKGDRAEFRAAQVLKGKVTLLRDEGSHMLRSLVDADALVFLPAEQRAWNAGDLIEVHYLSR